MYLTSVKYFAIEYSVILMLTHISNTKNVTDIICQLCLDVVLITKLSPLVVLNCSQPPHALYHIALFSRECLVLSVLHSGTQMNIQWFK